MDGAGGAGDGGGGGSSDATVEQQQQRHFDKTGCTPLFDEAVLRLYEDSAAEFAAVVAQHG